MGLAFGNWATAGPSIEKGWGVMRLSRRGTALMSVAVLAGACTALPGASDAIPSDPPSPSLLGASQDPTTAPVASPEVRPSPVPPIAGDVAPPEVMGATFLAELSDGVTVVGRVGLKERLVVPAGSFAFFDRNGTVIISTPGATDTELSRIDIATGEVVWRTSVPGDRYASAVSEPLLLGGQTSNSVADPGLILVDVATGSSRVLVPSRPAPRDAISWSRSALVTPSGTQVLTSLCAFDRGCENSLVDVADGSTVRTLPGTTPAIIATDRFAVTYDGHSVTGIDLRNGEAVWARSDEDLEFSGGYAIAGQRLVTAWLDRTAAPIFRIELIDLPSGRGNVIAERDFSEDWTLWPELSGEASAVIGHGGRIGDAATDGKPLEAAVVDLATGAFDDGAVRLVPVQP